MKRNITLDHAQVMEILPHREPMLLIDTVSSLIPGKEVKASLYIDPAWDIFRGHFPENPVLPGVYTVEACTQAANILLLTMERYAGTTPLFLGINNVRFWKKILPGDTITIYAALLSERKDKAVATCWAMVSVAGDTAAEAEVTSAMRCV